MRMLVTPERNNVLMKIIALAKERREVTADEGVVTLSTSAIQDYYDSEENDRERQLSSALYEYLLQLQFEEVKFVQTLMYIGRDESLEENVDAESLYKDVYASLRWDTQELEAEEIVDKMPLDEYLRRGMELMES